MSTYVPVTIDDMRPLFQKKDSRGIGWEEGIQYGEIIFDFPLASNCVVRVYSTIRSQSDIGARKGNDSIKVCAFDPIANRGLVKASRVYRTTNWKNNLKNRVYEVFGLARERISNG